MLRSLATLWIVFSMSTGDLLRHGVLKNGQCLLLGYGLTRNSSIDINLLKDQVMLLADENILKTGNDLTILNVRASHDFEFHISEFQFGFHNFLEDSLKEPEPCQVLALGLKSSLNARYLRVLQVNYCIATETSAPTLFQL